MVLKEGALIAEHYVLIKQLGHGSFGNVWLAHNELADIHVAIKFYAALDSAGLEEFRHEGWTFTKPSQYLKHQPF